MAGKNVDDHGKIVPALKVTFAEWEFGDQGGCVVQSDIGKSR